MYARLIAQDADEVAIFSLILQRAGLAVTTTKDLEETMRSWSERPADILLLALPAPSPQDQVRRVRTETQVPLLIATAWDEANLQVELLKLGADLVIRPTFNPKLLIAQIGVLLRRASNIPTFSLPTLSAADLTLDPTTRTVEVNGKPSRRLTHLEFRLLYTLMINRGQVMPTETLVERVWGYTGQGDRELVRGLISRLRNKVELDPHDPQYILTMPGIGYIFKEQKSSVS